MNKPIVRFLFCLVLSGCAIAASAQSDSLLRELRKAKTDTTRMLLYSQLALIPAQDIKISMAYLDSALRIGEHVTDKNYTGRIIKNKGEIYSGRALPDSAIFYFKQAVDIYTLTSNWNELSMTYYSLGNMYSLLEKSDLAQQAFVDGATIAHSHNVLRGEAYCRNGLATIHFKLNNYPEAKRAHLDALKIANEIGDPKLTAWINTGLGNTMIQTHKLDSALMYFNAALDNYSAANYLPGIAGAHNNIGVCYSFMERFDEAIPHYRIAAETKHKYGELNGESTALNNISQLYVLVKQPDSAIFYARASLKIARNLPSLKHQQMAFGYAADAFASASQFDSAYTYERLFKQYTDSINDQSLSEKVTEMQAKYESDQQQQQIALLEKTNQIGQLWNYVFAALGIIVAVIAVFIFLGYSNKKKANALLETQNIQITEQKKEITDSIVYAKKIQQALLASNSLIRKNVRDHFVLYRPKDIVSGDFYWASNSQNAFWIAVCDSTGHGVPGAFMSLLNTTFLAEAINEREISKPGEVFDFARKKLIENLSRDEHADAARNDGMDGILLKIAGTTVSYANANGSALHIRNGIGTELAADKMPVGRSPKETSAFSTHSVEVQKGDVIYLFTDGYADQFGGEKGKKFKHKALIALLHKIHQQTAEQQKLNLETEHLRWKSYLEQVDDILVVGLFF